MIIKARAKLVTKAGFATPSGWQHVPPAAIAAYIAKAWANRQKRKVYYPS